MAKKKSDTPPEFKRHFYINWFVQDWLGDQNLKLCPADAKGFWMDLLMQMVLGFPFGHLSRISKPLIEISKIKGLNNKTLAHLLYQSDDQNTEQLLYQVPKNLHGVLDDTWVRLSVGLPLYQQLSLSVSLEAQIPALTGYPPEKVKEWLGILDDLNIFSRTQAGIIYNRRMVRDFQKRKTAFINACNGVNIYSFEAQIQSKKHKQLNTNNLDALPQQNINQTPNQSTDQNPERGYSNPLSNRSSSNSSSINGSNVNTDDSHKKAKTNFQISSSTSSEIGRLLMGDEVVIQCANESWQDVKWRKRVCETYGLTAIELKTWMNDFNLNLANSEKQPLDIGRYQNRLTGHIKSQQNKGIKTPSAIDPKNANGGISHYEQL